MNEQRMKVFFQRKAIAVENCLKERVASFVKGKKCVVILVK